MQYVFLTDDDDGTALIACPDAETADSVGAAAIWNSGGVSAWRMLDGALTDTARVIEILQEGGNMSDLVDAGLSSVPIEISSEPWAARVLSTVRDWTDEEFELAFGSPREE